MPSHSVSLTRILLLSLATAPVVFTAGCGIGTSAPNSAVAIGAVSGFAHGGRQPIIGSAVTLYAASNGGYATAATVLGTATTLGDGSFSITRNSSTCTDPDQLYLVASGGDAGGGTNSAITLVEALGTCSSITTATTGLNINEITTIAAAYTLAGFAKVDGASTDIGTASTNLQGLQHAFLNAANLAQLNGTVRPVTVGQNGTVPTAVIDSLANALATCVNSSDPTSTGCGAILVAPPTGIAASLIPTNTWQAALNWGAPIPATTPPAFTATSPPPRPICPSSLPRPTSPSALPTTPGIRPTAPPRPAFPGTSRPTPTTTSGYPAKPAQAWSSSLRAVRSCLLPPAGDRPLCRPPNLRGIAFDNLTPSNVWLGDSNGNVWAYNPTNNTSTKVVLPTSITVGTTATPVTAAAVPVAVDASNNVWYGTFTTATAATQTLGEIPTGTFTAQTTYAFSPLYPETTKGSYSMTVDAANSIVWAGSQSAGHVYTFPTGVTGPVVSTTATSTANPINTIAQDGSGNTWAVYQGSGVHTGAIYKFSSTNPTTTPTLIASPSGASIGLYNPRGLAIDGVGRLFVISFSTPAAVVEYDPSLATASTPAGYLLNASSNGFAPVDSGGNTILVASGPRNATIDSTGSLWLSNGTAAGQPGAVQIFGIAAPTVAPLSLGKYGVRP